MNGVNATTGKRLSGFDHVRQSITDILMTPLGSRVYRRDYGSKLFSLIDAPMNGMTKLQIYMATIEALMQWEPRLLVQKVGVQRSESGGIEISMRALYLPDGKPITIDGIVIE